MTSIVVFDYGFGNIRSMVRAVAHQGVDVELTNDYRRSLEADGVVVPGVGAFSACMDGLVAVNGDRLIRERLRLGRPVLGVCVGLQVMFEQGLEHGGVDGAFCVDDADSEVPASNAVISGGVQFSRLGKTSDINAAGSQQSADGLGLIAGTVSRLDAPVVPHMGWDTVETAEGSALFHGLDHERFYFVHSYAAESAAAVPSGFSNEAPHISWCTYGASRFVAAYEQGPLSATQFHPEKSGRAGSTLLHNWISAL